MNTTTLKTLEKKLNEEARELAVAIQRSRAAEEEIQIDNTEDQGDLAAISHDKALLHTLQESDCHRLRSIQEALDRVPTGQYGSCTQCGDEIEVKRLTVIPWASFCLPCQEEVEQRQTLSRAHPRYGVYADSFAPSSEVIQ